ncbi:MAG: polyamine aminopropyltransferase [Verrucomicrobiales bacterium]
MGGCGLAYEYTFSKIAADLLGNSARQWALVICIMLFCMGLGAEIQRHIPGRKILGSLLASQILLALLGGFGPFFLLSAFAWFPFNFGLVQYGLISLIGILIGFEIPLITRLNEDYSANIESNLASVLKFDYIGALVGGLVWTFLLPRFFNIHESAYILAFATLAAAFLCWLILAKRRHPAGVISLFAATAALAFGYQHSRQWALHAEQALFRDRIIHTATTPYQHIVLTQSQAGNLRCYINGHIQFSSTDEAIYHENLVHPAMQVAPRKNRVLVLGGGDGLALREILKYPEVAEIVLVDLDPEMTRLASEHPLLSELNAGSLSAPRVRVLENEAHLPSESAPLPLPNQRRPDLPLREGPTLRILNLDATRYAQQADGLFDLIFLDFPDPSSPGLAKLYARPFYQALREKLSPEGLLVQQSASPDRTKEAFLCIGRTLEAAGFAALPYHDHVPSFGEWGWWIATPRSSYSQAQLRQRILDISSLPDQLSYLTPALIHGSLHFGKNQLQTQADDITTLSQPAVLQHYLRGWQD